MPTQAQPSAVRPFQAAALVQRPLRVLFSLQDWHLAVTLLTQAQQVTIPAVAAEQFPNHRPRQR